MSAAVHSKTNGLRGGSGGLQLAPPPCAVELHQVEVRYDPHAATVLAIDELQIGEGERVAIIGPSGSGKTSLLRLLNGYVQPSSGTVSILGETLSAKHARRREIRRRIGFIFQNFHLIERATVFDNVLWGRLGRVNPWLSLLGKFGAEDRERTWQAIEEVDLMEQATQRTDTLSSGQQQRVAVARVLAQQAELLLADEPVSNLDPALAEEVLSLLAEVSVRHGATLIMSLHQPQLAKRYAERVIGLRRGRVVHDAAAALLTDSAIDAIYERELRVSPESGSKVTQFRA